MKCRHLLLKGKELLILLFTSDLRNILIFMLGLGIFWVVIGHFFSSQGLEGEDEGAISMLSDNTAKLTSAVRYVSSISSLKCFCWRDSFRRLTNWLIFLIIRNSR